MYEKASDSGGFFYCPHPRLFLLGHGHTTSLDDVFLAYFHLTPNPSPKTERGSGSLLLVGEGSGMRFYYREPYS
jgi:hypothetical protein